MTQTASERVDPAGFAHVDVNDPDNLIGFLDARQAIPDEQRVKADITSLLDLCVGLTVLDVGCGTGHDTCLLAEKVTASGSVIGVDASARMVAEARRRAAEQGSAGAPTFREANATELPFPEETFDRVRIERVLMHLTDPASVIGELVRVTRRTGLVVASELDAATVFLGGTQQGLIEHLEHDMLQAFPAGRVGRHLPRLFAHADLVGVRCIPRVIINSVAFLRFALGGRLDRLVTAGAVTASAADRFWTDQETGEREGWLVTGITCFTVVGQKP